MKYMKRGVGNWKERMQGKEECSKGRIQRYKYSDTDKGLQKIRRHKSTILSGANVMWWETEKQEKTGPQERTKLWTGISLRVVLCLLRPSIRVTRHAC